MRRRRASLVDVLMVLPWWVSLVVADTSYLLLTFVAPKLHSEKPLLATMVSVAPKLAPFVGGFFLAIAVASFARAIFISWKFNAQRTIADLRALSWREFESIVGEAFRQRGYFVVENAVDGPDEGIDLILRKDGKKYFVQCKHWKAFSVGVKPVRELFGVVAAHKADGGFFVASGAYTQEARTFARTSGIRLIDGKELVELVAEVLEGRPMTNQLDTARVEQVISSIGDEPPLCPMCSAPMVSRTAKRGVGAGSRFWGCPRYPVCRGTRAL